MVFDSVSPGAGAWDEHADRIESAVRHLVRLVRGQARGRTRAPDRVLLDLQVDDLRCRIERVDAAPNTAPNAVSMEQTTLLAESGSPAESTAAGGMLSPRETEVAIMVAQGYPNKAIAAALHISSFTVSSYLRRIFAKLGVNSRAAMVAQALEHHLLPEPLARRENSDTQ